MRFKNLLLKNSFLKDVFNLSSGYAVSQLIVIIFSPLLTRLYSPAEFGIFFFFTTTASVLSVISTGSYEKSIVAAKGDQEAGELFRFAIILTIAVSALSFIIFIFLHLPEGSFFESKAEKSVLLLVPLYALFMGLFRIFQHLNIRRSKFARVSSSFIIRSSSLSAAQAGFGFSGMGSGGLIIGSLLGQVIPVIRECLDKSYLTGLFRRDRLAESFRRAREYSDYPAFRMPSELMNEASIQAPVFILKFIFSDAITGLYTFPQKILYQPSRFISQAVADVFFRKASELNAEASDTGELTFRTYKNLFLAGVIPYMIFLLWGQEIFTLVFGSEWGESGRIASWLSPWMFLVFIGSPISSVFLVTNRLRLSFILNFLLLVFRIASLLAGAVVFGDAVLTIILFSAVSVVYWIAITVWSLYLSNVNLLKALYFSLAIIALALIILLPLKLCIL